ncbi:MAG: UbiA-like protein EboC [Acidobacteria bacterium]|nr:UbiA-like protein EboC [Acidobacteriota bacterium]
MATAVLQLLRPANVATAAADVVAGYAVAGTPEVGRLPWLVAASACLYAGGVVLNDLFDRHVDARERPERPIPSGRIRPARAGWLGGTLVAAGPLAAASANPTAGLVAAALAGAVLLYDALAKRSALAGPLVMGGCRGLNFALGLAAAPDVLRVRWPVALFAVLYIAGVTLLSRGEVSGAPRAAAAASLALICATALALAVVALRHDGAIALALVLTAAFTWRVVPPFWQAYRQPAPAAIRQAVKRGVLSLVLLDAVLAAAYAGPACALAVIATGLVAGYLARFFAVT